MLSPGASLAIVTLTPHRGEDRWGVYDYHLRERRAAEDVLAHAESVKRSTSQLADLSEQEFAAGLSRIRAAIAASPSAPTALEVDLRLRMYVFTSRR